MGGWVRAWIIGVLLLYHFFGKWERHGKRGCTGRPGCFKTLSQEFFRGNVRPFRADADLVVWMRWGVCIVSSNSSTNVAKNANWPHCAALSPSPPNDTIFNPTFASPLPSPCLAGCFSSLAAPSLLAATTLPATTLWAVPTLPAVPSLLAVRSGRLWLTIPSRLAPTSLLAIPSDRLLLAVQPLWAVHSGGLLLAAASLPAVDSLLSARCSLLGAPSLLEVPSGRLLLRVPSGGLLLHVPSGGRLLCVPSGGRLLCVPSGGLLKISVAEDTGPGARISMGRQVTRLCLRIVDVGIYGRVRGRGHAGGFGEAAARRIEIGARCCNLFLETSNDRASPIDTPSDKGRVLVNMVGLLGGAAD